MSVVPMLDGARPDAAPPSLADGEAIPFSLVGLAISPRFYTARNLRWSPHSTILASRPKAPSKGTASDSPDFSPVRFSLLTTPLAS